MARWMRGLSASSFTSFNQLKQAFRHVDYAAPFTIFNVGGNSYRIISRIDYSTKALDVRWVLTHSEYDRTRRFQSGKVKP